MDKTTARKIADGLTWARTWSAIPMTVVRERHIFLCDGPATEPSGA